MKPTSRNVIRKVFELYFQGDSHQTIATKLDLPRPTVSDILSLLPESINPLRELAVDTQKQDLTVYEAKKGAELRNRLHDLGVSFDRVESFVESMEKSTDPLCAPALIVQAVMKLDSLEKETGKTYSEMLIDFEEKKDDIKGMETREHELTENIGTLEKEQKRKIADNNVTDKELAYNAHLRQDFRKYGIKLSDAESLKKYLQNMEETEGDPRNSLNSPSCMAL
jgi:hypothetical protein